MLFLLISIYFKVTSLLPKCLRAPYSICPCLVSPSLYITGVRSITLIVLYPFIKEAILALYSGQ